jgi:hypothetical protein
LHLDLEPGAAGQAGERAVEPRITALAQQGRFRVQVLLDLMPQLGSGQLS